MADKEILLNQIDATDDIDLNSNDGSLDERDEISESKVVDLDEFLQKAGECGRYQVMIEMFILLSISSLTYPAMSFYYFGFNPPWKCVSSNITNHSSSFQSVCNTSHIYKQDDTKRCHLYRSEWTYEYSKVTLATEFDLVCDRAWLDALCGSIIFIGWGVGIIVMSYASDLYGRKRVMFPCLFLTLTFLLLHAVVKEIWQLLLVRLLLGFVYSAPALNNYIMIVELVGPSKRTLATTVASFLWPVGALLLTLKAKYIDNWRTLMIVCSAPYFATLLFALCIPESIRWLNLKGRTHDAELILRKAARINKRDVTGLSLRKVESEKSPKNKASYMDLFKRRKLAKELFVQAFIWFQTGMTYYGLNWAFADLGGDMYVNFILSFLVELPGNFMGWFLMQKIGRRKSAVAVFGCTALACFGVACVPKESSLKILRIVLGLTGKFMISIGFNVIYIWSSEIYATVLRSQGMAVMIIASRAGAATSPFIKVLDQLLAAAPFILMTVCSLIAAILSFLLPETLNKRTRETIEHMLHDAVEMTAIVSLERDTVTFSNDFEQPGDLNEEPGDDENDPLLLVPPVHI